MLKTIKIKQSNLDIFFSFSNNFFYFKKTPINLIALTFYQSSKFIITFTNQNKLRIKLQLWMKRRNFFYFKSFIQFYFALKTYKASLSLYDGFFVKLNLIGLGFRVQKISEKIFFFALGWANGVYLLMPKAIRMFILSKKRQVVIFSYDINKVFNIMSMLVLLRKTRPYRITGFVNPLFIQRLRSGKQR